MSVGRVSLVGAGPGDPELWTVRALRRVEEADLVLYDALVDAEGLRRMTNARCFCVGKRAGRASVKQETIHRLMIRAARDGKRVVRLKGGDPFVFGRGGEEALALAMAGIPFEVVPGLTVAVAAPGLAGIPLTHRGMASAFLVCSGHDPDALDLVAANSTTLVILMGMTRRGEILARLLAQGWRADMPAAIVCAAATADAWTWTGRLSEVARAVAPEGVPGVVIVGEVVRVRESLEASTAHPVVVEDEVKYGRS